MTESLRRAPFAASGFVLALLFVAALIYVPRLERAGRERLAVACAEIQSRITRETGFRVSFGSLSPSVLRGVSLDGLEASDGRGRRVFSARRAYLYYDIGALLLKKRQGFVSELRLEGVKIDLDSGDLELLSALSKRLSKGGKAKLPEFAISGSDLSLELVDAVPGGLSVSLGSFRLSGGGADADADFNGRVTIHRALNASPLEVPFGASGSLARDLSAGRLALSLAALSSSFALQTQRFDFAFNRRGAELRKIADKAPLDAEFRWEASTGLVSASLDMEGFEPRRSFEAKGALASIEPWLSLPYTGKLALSSSLRDPSSLRYDIDLSVSLSSSRLKGMRRAELRASGDATGARIAHAGIEGEIGQAEYSGSLRFRDWAPDGLLSLHSSPSSALPVEASVRLFGSAKNYAAVADLVSVGGVEFRDLVLDAALRPEAVDFNLSLLLPESEGSRTAVPGAAPAASLDRFAGEAVSGGGLPRLRLEGSLSLGSAPMLDLALALDSADIAPLGPLLERLAPRGLAGLASNFRIDGELYFRSDFSRFSYSATNLLIVPRSTPGSYVLLSLSGNDKGLTLRRGELSGGGYTASLSGSLDYSTPEQLDFKASLVYGDTPYELHGTVAGSDVFLSGDYGLNASLRQRDGEYFFSLGAESLPIPLGGVRTLLSFDSNGYYASPKDFRLDLGSLRAAFPGSASLPALSCVGLFGPKEGSLSSISVKDAASELRGGMEFSYDLAARRPGLAFHGRLDGASGESYGLEGSYGPSGDDGPYALAATLGLAASPLSRFIKGSLSGRLNGSVVAQGGLSDLGLRFAAKLSEGLLGGEPLALQASGTERGGRFELSGCSASYRGMSLDRVGLSFDSSTAEASLSGDFRFASPLADASAKTAAAPGGKAGGPLLSFSFSASGRSLAEAGDKKTGVSLLFSRYRVEGEARDFRYRDSSTARWPFVLSLAPEAMNFSGGEGGELKAEYRSDGSFSALAASPLPFSFEASGRSSAGEIEAKLSNLSVDLPLVMGFAGPLPLNVERGRISGAVSAQGAISDPDFSGSLELEDFVCRVPSWLPASIGPVSCPILIDGKRLSSSIPSLSAGDAKASLEVSAVMNGWIPSDLEARLKTLPGSSLDLNAQVLGIALKGRAGADLDFELSGGALSLSGKLMVERSDVVINPGLFGSSGSSRSAAAPFGLDLAIGFGPGVRVYFPSKELPVVMGYADPASSLRVLIDGQTGDLSFKGSALLRGGDVFYIQRDFYLKSARIAFNETNEKFDPLLTLEAERHERKDEEQVLITLSADSQPISNFTPKISADDPTLTQAQIVNLLGAGLLGGSDGSDIDWKAAAIAGTEFIPQLNVTKTFENKVREVFGLDVFFLQSQVVQRWLIDISETGSTATSNSLASYLDGTSLYVGKYLGDSVFLHASASVDKDPLVRMGLLRLDSEFGVDFETPFGRLMWSISPESPENLFISDQSLSLSWKLQL